MLEDVCKSRGFSIVRMDGATPQKERMGIVEKFNMAKEPGIKNTVVEELVKGCYGFSFMKCPFQSFFY